MENALLDCAMDSFSLVLKNAFSTLVFDVSFNTVAALVPILPLRF